MKTCPYCAEEIKDAAIRCRWCLTWLVETVPAGAEGPSPTAEARKDRGPHETPEPVPPATIEQPVAAAKPARPVPAADTKIEFTHTGTRYLLGYGGDYFGIWDRNAPQQPLERFPRNDQGWAAAWQRYAAMETNWMDLRTGQKSG